MRPAPLPAVLSLSLATALSMTLAAPASSTSFTQSCFATYGSPGLTVGDFDNDSNVDVAISPGTAAGRACTSLEREGNRS